MPAAGFLETVFHDVVYALRTMRKNPAFAATATLTLALGISGNSARQRRQLFPGTLSGDAGRGSMVRAIRPPLRCHGECAAVT